ncbi:MAG TPA: response regulator transcription factor [Nitrolancea sp.]|nr:response regulator transcription factor [Nitrolancea sp.]
MSTPPVVVPLILLVDDDRTILLTLRLQLEADGFRVMSAEHGQRALALAQGELPHLAIVDLMMPGIDGFALARQLRHYADLPIIMLTAIDDPAQKIAGLTHFADDYVTKPFTYGELLARIRNLLARAWPQGRLVASTCRVDDALTIDFARHVIHAGQEQRSLTPTEARLLHLLVKNRGQILPNELLLDRLWPEGNGTMSSLWEYIRRLRDKLDDPAEEPRYIESERGVGYRFRAE